MHDIDSGREEGWFEIRLIRPEEAAEHLRFVAQYGNRLAIRSRAEELLELGR